MSWFYSYKGQQKGPVSACDLLVLESSGIITRGTLVWAEGMPDWRALDAVREQVRVEAGEENLSRFAVCAHSQEVHPRSEMIAYGDRFIAPQHKDAFVQSLHEGTTLSEEVHKGEMRFVGFWWRALASTIDSLVKGAVSMMLMIPVGVLAMPAIEHFSNSGDSVDSEAAAVGMIAGFLGAYFFMFFVATLAGLFYETWMVGKYGGTVGKIALRLRIVNADGSKPTYAKAFGRWAAEVLSKGICFSIMYGVQIAFLLIFGIAAGGFRFEGSAESQPLMGAGLVLVSFVASALACFPWWMAGCTAEKKALHDVICGTRVVFK